MTGALNSCLETPSTSVFAIGALTERPAQVRDPVTEKRALLALAALLSRAPAEILPAFVEWAITLTGATSAGLAMLADQPTQDAPQALRWRYTSGLLAPLENQLMPQGSDLSARAQESDEPVLAAHAEQQCAAIARAGLRLPEVLVVPLTIDEAEPLGALWLVAGAPGYFHQGHVDSLVPLVAFVGVALKVARQEQRLRDQCEEQELLAEEMDHRLKNVFAMTVGMIHSSARLSPTVQDLAAALTGRLQALAKAHSLVQRRVSALDPDRSIDLGHLIAAVTRVLAEGDGSAGQITMCGPPVDCGAHAANSLALMFHELTTNAAKYGALSEPGGAVEIAWRHDNDDIVLDWRESGGPRVAAANPHQGFGTTLIARTVQQQFDGRADYAWVPSGLALTLRFAADSFSH